MPQPESASNIDPFLYRLAAAASAGVSFLATTYGVYFALRSAPQMRTLFVDFDMALPSISVWALTYLWFLLSVAVAAIIISVLAIFRPGRMLLSSAFVLSFLAVVAAYVENHAERVAFDSLFLSLTGAG